MKLIRNSWDTWWGDSGYVRKFKTLNFSTKVKLIEI